MGALCPGSSRAASLVKAASVAEMAAQHNIAEDDVNELMQVYSMFCGESSGKRMTKEDMQKAMLKMGVEAAAVPMLVDAFDADANGCVDADEFVSTISIMTKGDDEEKLRVQFRSWAHGRARLSLTEIIKGLQQNINVYQAFILQSKGRNRGLSREEKFDEIDAFSAVCQHFVKTANAQGIEEMDENQYAAFVRSEEQLLQSVKVLQSGVNRLAEGVRKVGRRVSSIDSPKRSA